MANSTPPAKSAPVVETLGIDIVPESERTAKPSDLFWPWFAANISVFGISYGSFVLWFGLSFWQAAVVTVLGVTFSFFLCGLIAVAGKRGSAPTMVLSRAAFGVKGQKVPGVVSWLTSIGWETFLAIMAVLATTTVIRELGGNPGTGTKVLATLIVAGLVVGASVLGYHTIIKLQSVLTWITGAVTILYMGLTIPRIDWTAVQAIPAGSVGNVVGALVMVMTGFGLGWINIAADWSRYQRRDTSGGAIVAWNTIGGALAPTVLVLYGLLGDATAALRRVGIDYMWAQQDWLRAVGAAPEVVRTPTAASGWARCTRSPCSSASSCERRSGPSAWARWKASTRVGSCTRSKETSVTRSAVSCADQR